MYVVNSPALKPMYVVKNRTTPTVNLAAFALNRGEGGHFRARGLSA